MITIVSQLPNDANQNLLAIDISVISNEREKSFPGTMRFLAVLEMTRSSQR